MLKKNQISAKLKAIEAKLAELTDVEPVFYATASKYIPKVGNVNELPNFRECAKALNLVKSEFGTELGAAEELGLTAEDISTETKYLGFKYETWKKDIQKRVDELKRLKTIADLTGLQSILKKNRSADDIFNEEVGQFSDALNLI